MLLTVLFAFIFTSSISVCIFLEPTSMIARVVPEAMRLRDDSVTRTTAVVVFIVLPFKYGWSHYMPCNLCDEFSEFFLRGIFQAKNL